MANEAVIIELLGHHRGRPITYVVADGTGIAKGTVLKIVAGAPGRLAAASAGDDNFAGIAAFEKVKSDGSTTLTAYTHGIFDMVNGAAADLTAGMRCDVNGINLISKCDASGAVKSGWIILLEDTVKNATGSCLIGSGF